MKLSFFPLAVLGASVGIVSASPIRIVVLSDVASPTVRYGHAATASDVAAPKVAEVDAVTHAQGRRPCMGKMMHEKAIEVSNAFRQALGLPLIEVEHPTVHDAKMHHGPVYIRPLRIDHGDESDESEGRIRIIPAGQAAAYRHMKHHPHDFHRGSFMNRVHRALMTLGPWEGRAVAFVLGCGIGVLLRMFFVLTVVVYRMVKGERQEECEYTIVVEQDAEHILVPPPHYTVEKIGDYEVSDNKTVDA